LPEVNFGDALLGIIYGVDGTGVFAVGNIRVVSFLFCVIDVAVDGKGLLCL
jgi:hypothetical protein